MGDALSVGVVGGGIGGLAAALSLHRTGFDVHVYEQAGSVSEIGAGIQVSPNASRILHGLGLGDDLAAMGVRPLALHQRRLTLDRGNRTCTLGGVHSMEYRTVGSSGIEISRVGLGGYQLGPEPGEAPDVDRAVRVIESAIACGVNWLDTSENYLATRNESVIGPALAGVDHAFLVASKVAPGDGVTGGGSGFRREQVLKACRDSLERLGRDHLDLYFLHWPDDSGVPLEETWGGMAELVETGLVRAIGLSNYALEEIKSCHGQRPVDAIQVGLNLIDYVDDRPSIAACGDLGIAVTIFEPLASGVLSGKSLAQVREDWGDLWADDTFFKRTLDPEAAPRMDALLEALRLIADRLGVSLAELAIAWVLHQAGVTAAIAGSRNGSHMEANARAAALDLSNVLEEIEGLIALGPDLKLSSGF